MNDHQRLKDAASKLDLTQWKKQIQSKPSMKTLDQLQRYSPEEEGFSPDSYMKKDGKGEYVLLSDVEELLAQPFEFLTTIGDGLKAISAGHGHVRPRQDGFKARCGGADLCLICMEEEAMFKGQP